MLDVQQRPTLNKRTWADSDAVYMLESYTPPKHAIRIPCAVLSTPDLSNPPRSSVTIDMYPHTARLTEKEYVGTQGTAGLCELLNDRRR